MDFIYANPEGPNGNPSYRKISQRFTEKPEEVEVTVIRLLTRGGSSPQKR